MDAQAAEHRLEYDTSGGVKLIDLSATSDRPVYLKTHAKVGENTWGAELEIRASDFDQPFICEVRYAPPRVIRGKGYEGFSCDEFAAVVVESVARYGAPEMLACIALDEQCGWTVSLTQGQCTE